MEVTALFFLSHIHQLLKGGVVAPKEKMQDLGKHLMLSDSATKDVLGGLVHDGILVFQNDSYKLVDESKIVEFISHAVKDSETFTLKKLSRLNLISDISRLLILLKKRGPLHFDAIQAEFGIKNLEFQIVLLDMVDKGALVRSKKGYKIGDYNSIFSLFVYLGKF